MAQITRPNILLVLSAVVCAFFMVQGCVHKYDFYLEQPKDTTIVIEGMITNENKRQIIYVSQVSNYQNNKRLPVSGAKVAVTASNDSSYYYLEDTLNLGMYVSEYPFIGIAGNVYYLNIKYNSVTYTAESTMMPVPKKSLLQKVKTE